MTLQFGRPVLALYCACWAGIVIGVSFIATIAKFGAASLTRPIALDVGAQTFAMLARIEWGLAAVLALLILAVGLTRLRLIFLLVIAALLAVEALWIFPQLSARTALVISGRPLPPSPLHTYSVLAECAKVLLLAAFAVLESRKS